MVTQSAGPLSCGPINPTHAQVKAFCGRHGIPYMESGFWRAACNTFGGLRRTGEAELALRRGRRHGGAEAKSRTTN